VACYAIESLNYCLMWSKEMYHGCVSSFCSSGRAGRDNFEEAYSYSPILAQPCSEGQKVNISSIAYPISMTANVLLPLQIRVLFIWQRHGGSLSHLLVVQIHQLLVDLDLGRCKSDFSNEFQSLVADELASQPQERLLEVVV